MNLSLLSFTISDANTTIGVKNAQLFINGTTIGLTNELGETVYSTMLNSFQLIVKANGYQTNTSNLNVTNISQLYNIALQPILVPSVSHTSIKINCIPPSDGASAAITVDLDGTEVATGTTDQNGTTSLSVPLGLLTISAVKDGFNGSGTTITTPKDTTATIQMVKSADPGSEQAVSPGSNTSSSTAVIPWSVPISSTQLDENWIPPNSNDGTYLTGNNARIYIGNLFIDEVNMINFYMQDNKIPIYGYRSRFFDALAQGRSLVQGQFSINFIHEGYLYTALKEYHDTMDDLGIDDSTFNQLAELDRACETLQSQLSQVPVSQYANIAAALANAMTQRDAMIGDSDQSVVNKLKQTRLADSLNMGHDNYIFNAIYEDIIFDVVVQITRGGRTVTRRLEKCVLTGNSQTLDNSGNPLSDDYSFIARRLR